MTDVLIDDALRIVHHRPVAGVEAPQRDLTETPQRGEVGDHVLNHDRRSSHDVIACEQNVAGQKTQVIGGMAWGIEDTQLVVADVN